MVKTTNQLWNISLRVWFAFADARSWVSINWWCPWAWNRLPTPAWRNCSTYYLTYCTWNMEVSWNFGISLVWSIHMNIHTYHPVMHVKWNFGVPESVGWEVSSCEPHLFVCLIVHHGDFPAHHVYLPERSWQRYKNTVLYTIPFYFWWNKYQRWSCWSYLSVKSNNIYIYNIYIYVYVSITSVRVHLYNYIINI